MKKVRSFFVYLVFALLSIFSLFAESYGCTCSTSEPCQAYSSAKSVFVGDLVDLQREVRSDRLFLIGSFKVKTTFKGQTEKLEKVTFRASGCQPKLIVGESLFVYKGTNEDNTVICDRTVNIQEAAFDLDYAKLIANQGSLFSVGGRIEGVSIANLSRIKIKSTSGKRVSVTRPSDLGYFWFRSKSRPKSELKVEIIFPKRFRWQTRILGEYSEWVESKRIQYSVVFPGLGCNFREISVFQIGPK